jgi:acyl-coenzyme A synthetase/AMP-(fatty) acid ligase/acyl carrier protein
MAVETSTQKITYNELNKVSNRLAHALVVQRGFEVEPVALHIDDPVFAIASHLGVLKAGKISLFIDPSDSPSRKNHILENAQPSVIIIKGEPAAWLAGWADTNKRLIQLDRLSPDHGDDDLSLTIHPDAPAYIRHTSGSTGHAKGAIKTHRHILHSVQTHTNYFHFCDNDRFAIIGRDYLGKRTFEALLNGATLYPFDIKGVGLHHLAKWLIEKKITTCKFFPTAYRHFISTLPGNKDFKDLRLVHLEGESVYWRDVDLYKTCFSTECVLVNSYSSTETGPISFYLIDKDSQFTSRVPIGYAIDRIKIRLIDEVGKPVGVNEPGEIVVTSSFLSAGYWKNSETDAEQSRWKEDGDREIAYFTGDLGSMSDNGCLEHLGRKDSQVKIRSFRVNIGEVEATLVEHSEVKEAAVIAKKTQSGDWTLIAYLLPKAFPPPTTTNLRTFFKNRLPDYMIPSTFITLEKMPVTSTGKINRRELPQPGNSRPELGISYAAPRTSVETELERIWASVLYLNHVGINDNFFDLGGHSLAASRVISRVIQTFQLELPIKALFDAPSVAEMAAIITQHQAKRASDTELAQMLREVEAMTEEEAQRRVDEFDSTIPPK